MDSAKKVESGPRFSRSDWLREALNFLRRSGGGELRIERLTQALGVTKGSFYHHFRNRDDFIDAVLEYWYEEYNLAVEKALATHTGSPKDKFRLIMRMVYEHDLSGYDLPLRAWALDNKRARSVVRKADQFRMNIVHALFGELGFQGEAQEIRSRMFLTVLGMEIALYDRPTKAKLIGQIESRLDFFLQP